jgi:hypothetical protein
LAASAEPCKIYPRILGSSDGTTTIWSIDANLNADRLVAIGKTDERDLIGQPVTSSIPFIAMYSITTTRIYYGFSDISSQGYYGFRVNFSPNALYFAALTMFNEANLNKIQVFDTSTGILKSSRSYSTVKKHDNLFT